MADSRTAGLAHPLSMSQACRRVVAAGRTRLVTVTWSALVLMLLVAAASSSVDGGRVRRAPPTAKWHQPAIDPAMAYQPPAEAMADAADYIADYAAFANEEYDQSILAMLEEHIKMQQQPFGQTRAWTNARARFVPWE